MAATEPGGGRVSGAGRPNPKDRTMPTARLPIALPRSVFAVMLLLSCALAAMATAETRTVQLPDGRSYRIDLPARPEGAPLIVALHGGGGAPDQFARNAGLSGPATAAGYAVIYPAGSGRTRLLTWNGGYCCAWAAQTGSDDVAFLDRVVADAAGRFGLDRRRLYLTGMSNGAIMAERYAAERPRAVRAVAGVAGTMDPAITVGGPVPLLHIHGTADRNVPYAGGVGSGVAGTAFAPVRQVIDAFRQANATGAGAERRVVAEGGAVATEDTWRDPEGRPAVRLLTIEGGGHVWPGGRRAGGGGIDANAHILRFFGEHP